MRSVNPATEETIETYEPLTTEQLDDAVEESTAAHEHWKETSIQKRTARLEEAARILEENSREYGELIAREMGKPLSQAVGEIEKCAWGCEFYAEKADEFLQEELVGTYSHAETYVRYEPLGPVLAVMPWNYPFWQVIRFAVPNLALGNTCLLKHASNVSGCALAVEEVFQKAGVPEGAFSSLLVGSDQVSEILQHDGVKAATVTGSEFAGQAVAEEAGRQLMKTVLELGGSDPFVVLADADLEHTATRATTARNQNSGQSCIAAKRIIVVDEVYDEFVELFTEKAEQLTVGDPMAEETDIGPQAREDLMEELHGQVERSIDDGATATTGGKPLDGDGYFYPPTVLRDVSTDSPAAMEETFGPVAAVMRAADEEEAIELANRTEYGLGGSIWTGDADRGKQLAAEIEAGCVFVNEVVKSDPRLPFGGIGLSGYGRELGRDGIREFANKKTVWVQEQNPSE